MQQSSSSAGHEAPRGNACITSGGLLSGGLDSPRDRGAIHADAIDRVSVSLASRDPVSVAWGFVDWIRDRLAGAGVSVDIEDPSGTQLFATRGISESVLLGMSYTGVLDALRDGLNAGSDAQITIDDLAQSGLFKDSLLLDAIEGAGFRSMIVLPARTGSGRLHGTVIILRGDSSGLDDTVLIAVRLFVQRMMLALENIWLVQSSENAAARLQSIVDSAHDAIFSLGSGGLVEFVNRAAVRVFGYSEHELRGRSLDFLLCPSACDGKLTSARRLVDQFAVGALHEVECRRRDGTTIHADLTIGEIDGGRGYSAILRDITARKAAESRMRDADRLAVLGTLAAGLGHDMNNVLLPMRAHVNALGATKRLADADRTAHVDRVRAGLSYLQHLADSLHGLALDPDGEGDGISSTDLAAWWQSSGPLLAKALRRGIVLEAAVPADIPAVAVPPHALTRAVLNLLVNASEAMPKDRSGHWPKVVIRARANGHAAHLEVADNGSGMSPDVVRRAFDMFFTTKTRGLGTGLGLPLVRRVVERAGGSIEIDSRAGLGTTVRLVLPYAAEESSGAPALATLKMDDGRAAAMITGALQSRGATVDPSVAFLDADLAIVECTRIAIEDLRRWTDSHPAGCLVIFGRPRAEIAAEAAARGVSVISEPDDIAAIEHALDAALENQQGTEPKEQ